MNISKVDQSKQELESLILNADEGEVFGGMRTPSTRIKLI